MVAPLDTTRLSLINDLILVRDRSGRASARNLSSRTPASPGPARRFETLSSFNAMTTDWTQTTRALKAVVIVLGVLIAVGATVLVVEVFNRLLKPGGGDSPEGFATTAVALPAGARVITMTGEDDTLSLLVEGPDGRQQVITVDRRDGAVLGTLDLTPEETAQ